MRCPRLVVNTPAFANQILASVLSGNFPYVQQLFHVLDEAEMQENK